MKVKITLDNAQSECPKLTITEDGVIVKKLFLHGETEIGFGTTRLALDDFAIKDGIIIYEQGGTDNIDNIQPMCISWNASKKDFLEVVG